MADIVRFTVVKAPTREAAEVKRLEIKRHTRGATAKAASVRTCEVVALG